MFRPQRKQKTILDHGIYLPEDRQKALEKSWAGPFMANLTRLGLFIQTIEGFIHYRRYGNYIEYRLK